MHPSDTLETLRRDNPEWRPWLALVEATLEEIENDAWSEGVPPVADGATPGVPLLAHTLITIDPAFASRWLRRLLTLAAQQSPGLATLPSIDPAALIQASLEQDRAGLERMAETGGGEAKAFAAIAGLAVVPLLHACERVWHGGAESDWSRGYCPICGAWPTLAEARGVERDRRFRCGRCAGDWASEWLHCPFCGTREHTRLGALVSEAMGERRKVETCGVCRGYVKTITTLKGLPPKDLLLEDLVTAELDVAALAAGYRRPDSLPLVLDVRVEARAKPARSSWLSRLRR